MATITGTVEPSQHGAEGYFTFSLDGMSTSKQMEKLIALTSDLVKKTVGEDAESLKQLKEQTKAVEVNTAALEDSADAITSEKDKRKKLDQEIGKSTLFISRMFHGNFGTALDDSSKGLAVFATGIGFAYAKLENYGNSLGEGLKRGIAGSTFDLAIAAKSAGVKIETFTKALSESGGGFASLGVNATDGAMQFGNLVKSVRLATAPVGNLGMNLDELSMFTAQQTKTAVLQGFKGKAAQDVVIKNSRSLGKELDVLASRTGKSVLELAQAAMKLSQDSVVTNFVRNMGSGNKEVSASIQSFAASMTGLFGDMGDKISTDAIQSAISGLPLAITETGQNVFIAGTGLYQEIERQAKLAKDGVKITEQDQEKMRDLVMQTSKVREKELAVLSQIPGAAGDSARQLLKMANAASTYNDADKVADRKRADAAKRFNTELRSLQASLQELLIPFLKAINMIDFASVFRVISFIPRKIADIMDFFGNMIKSLPEGLVDVLSFIGSGLSGVIGTIIGVGVLLGGIAIGAKLLQSALGLMGQGLNVLGFKTLPLYASKYTIVNNALDSFIASLLQAATALKTGININGGSPIDLPEKSKRQQPPPKPKSAAEAVNRDGSLNTKRQERLDKVARGREELAKTNTPPSAAKARVTQLTTPQTASTILGPDGKPFVKPATPPIIATPQTASADTKGKVSTILGPDGKPFVTPVTPPIIATPQTDSKPPVPKPPVTPPIIATPQTDSKRQERLDKVAKGRVEQQAKAQLIKKGLSIAKSATGAAGLVSLATDILTGILGEDTFLGKISDTISSVAFGASVGGMGGAMFGGIGAIPGAIGGGILGLSSGVHKNYFSDRSESMSGEITSKAAQGDNPVLTAQLAQMELQKKHNDLMLESINEQSMTNRLASMGLGKDDELARRISNINFNA